MGHKTKIILDWEVKEFNNEELENITNFIIDIFSDAVANKLKQPIEITLAERYNTQPIKED